MFTEALAAKHTWEKHMKRLYDTLGDTLNEIKVRVDPDGYNMVGTGDEYDIIIYDSNEKATLEFTVFELNKFPDGWILTFRFDYSGELSIEFDEEGLISEEAVGIARALLKSIKEIIALESMGK